MAARVSLWHLVCIVAMLCLPGCQRPPATSSVHHPGAQAADATVDPPELALDYDAFDQSPGHGWRKFVEAGDHRGAATLIDRYLARKDHVEDWQRINLSFHAGQLYAYLGDNATALARFNAAINPNEPQDSPIRWNVYVKATIAFLEHDREQLTRMRDEIAHGPRFQGTRVNLEVVEHLLAHFGEPYRRAYGVD